MEGWIKLHRQILDNPITCKDSDYFSVWCYLLLNATHKEHFAVFGKDKIKISPGQLITGRKVISTHFKIDESKVQRILKTLENEHQIEQKTSNRNRLITILNWSSYQEFEHHNEQQLNNDCTTNAQQMNTYKNERKKERKKILYIDLSFIDDVITNVKLSQEQYDKLKEKFGVKLLHEKINALNVWVTEKKVKDHYLTLNNWCKKDSGNTTNTFEKRNAPRPNFD